MDKNDIVSNFYFMEEHDPIFFELARNGERVFKSDPNTTLMKLRQLGEALAKDIARRSNIFFEPDVKQSYLIGKLSRELNLDPNIKNIFHKLREEGNEAVHEFRTSTMSRLCSEFFITLHNTHINLHALICKGCMDLQKPIHLDVLR